MKKSLKFLLLIGLLFFVADRLVCSGLKLLDQKVFTGQSVGKVNHFLLLKDSVNLLTFGSSRANHHVDVKVMDSLSFNTGADGTKIAYSAALISSLEKKNQIILVHIDQSTLFNDDYDGGDVMGLKNLIGRNKNIENFIKEIFPKEVWLSKIFNCYKYNGKVLGAVKNYISPNHDFKEYYGYDPLMPSIEQEEIFNKLIAKTDFAEFVNESSSETPNSLVDKCITLI